MNYKLTLEKLERIYKEQMMLEKQSEKRHCFELEPSTQRVLKKIKLGIDPHSVKPTQDTLDVLKGRNR